MKSHLAHRAHRGYKMHRQYCAASSPMTHPAHRDMPAPSTCLSPHSSPLGTGSRDCISAEFLNTRRVDQHELPSAFRHRTIGGDG